MTRHAQALALAVALALVCALGGSLSWWWWRASPATPRVQPPLDRAQLQALPTYKRRCRKQSDCDGPLLCMQDPRRAGWRCLASECETDFQCQPGLVCMPFIYPGLPAIGLCLVQGTLEEGDSCDHFPLRAEWGCRPGLRCKSGFCGRPCDPDGSSNCPDGYTCRGGSSLPSCVPSCMRSQCPPERRCVQIDGEFSICATVHGQDCDLQPCPQGQSCRRMLGSRSQGRTVNMWCAVPCGRETSSACLPGFTCFEGYCQRLCDESVPGACGPGARCAKLFGPEGSLTICLTGE